MNTSKSSRRAGRIASQLSPEPCLFDVEETLQHGGELVAKVLK